MDYFESEDQALKEIERKFNLPLEAPAPPYAQQGEEEVLTEEQEIGLQADIDAYCAAADELIEEFEKTSP